MGERSVTNPGYISLHRYLLSSFHLSSSLPSPLNTHSVSSQGISWTTKELVSIVCVAQIPFSRKQLVSEGCSTASGSGPARHMGERKTAIRF